MGLYHGIIKQIDKFKNIYFSTHIGQRSNSFYIGNWKLELGNSIAGFHIFFISWHPSGLFVLSAKLIRTLKLPGYWVALFTLAGGQYVSERERREDGETRLLFIVTYPSFIHPSFLWDALKDNVCQSIKSRMKVGLVSLESFIMTGLRRPQLFLS